MARGLDVPSNIRYIPWGSMAGRERRSRESRRSRAAAVPPRQTARLSRLQWLMTAASWPAALRRPAALSVLLITFMIVVTPVVAGQNILARSGPIHLRSAPLSVAIPLDVDSWVMQSAADRDQLALYLQGVVFNGPPGTYYEIYVDLPAEVKNPDPGSANFVGRLTPNSQRELGSAIDSGNHIPYSIAAVVRALTQARTWNPETLTITFVPRGAVGAERGQPVRMSTVRVRIGGLLIVSG